MARTFSDGTEGQPGAAPESTLASGIIATATSLTVQAGHGARFPSSGTFSVRLEDAADPTHFEIVDCSSRSTDTLTIGATTFAWDSGDKVIHVISSADLDAFAETADLSAYQALSVYDAKGDILGGTAADTSGRLAVGSNGLGLVADSTASTGFGWAAVGRILGSAIQTTSADVAIATTTLTAVDTSLWSVTFTATTANVLVMATALAKPQGTQTLSWGILDSGGATVVAAKQVAWSTAGAAFFPCTKGFFVTGLTPGTSYTYRLAHRNDSGTSYTTYAPGDGMWIQEIP